MVILLDQRFAARFHIPYLGTAQNRAKDFTGFRFFSQVRRPAVDNHPPGERLFELVGLCGVASEGFPTTRQVRRFFVF
jgi:hypothetical protein